MISRVDQPPQIAVISWRDQEAESSKEFRFAEGHFRRCFSEYPLVLSEFPIEAGIDDAQSSHPWLAEFSRWFVVRSPMVGLPKSTIEDLGRVLDDDPDLVSVAAAEIGIDHPENAPHFPYYTWRGFKAFQEAMISRPPVVTPLIDRDPFVFMLDHGRIPSDLRNLPIVNLPRALPEDQTVIAGNIFVHPMADYYRYPRQDVVDLLPEKITSLLDIGCGSGAFGHVVRGIWGCRVVGVELNPGAAAKARLVLNHVIEGDITKLDLEERFDVITINDVLEHVEYPADLVKSLLEFVTPDGQLIVSIPNVGHWAIVEDLLAGHWDYLPAGPLCIDHLRFFTRRSMISMMEQAGWQPIHVHQIPGPLPEQKRELFHGILGREVQIDLENLESQGYIIVAKRPADSPPGT